MPTLTAPYDFSATHQGLTYKQFFNRHSELHFLWRNPGSNPDGSVRFEAGEYVGGALHWGTDVTDGYVFTHAMASGISFGLYYVNFPTPGPWPGLGPTRYWFFRVRAELADGSFSPWAYYPALPSEGSTAAQWQAAAVKFLPFPTSAAQIPAPTNLVVAQNDHSRVRLTWKDNASNESTHLLNISGPGLPAGGVEVAWFNLNSGEYLISVGYPFQGAYALQHEATYTARVRCRGGVQTTATNTFLTAWSNEVSFTTPPQASRW
jgi:hypothetical protein